MILFHELLSAAAAAVGCTSSMVVIGPIIAVVMIDAVETDVSSPNFFSASFPTS
jgi:hypothetical protein